MKLFRTFLTFALLGFIPFSCNLFCGNGSCCGNEPVPAYKITKMSVKDVEGDTQVALNPTLYQYYDKYSKVVYVKETEIASLKRTNSNFSLISQAYACSPVEDPSIQRLVKVDILSDGTTSYNEQWKKIIKGSKLNELFNLNKMPISSYIKSNPQIYHQHDFAFTLNSPPTDSVELTFNIKLTLSDSTEFVFENQRMKVK